MNYKIKVIGDVEVEVTPKVQLYSVLDFMGKNLHGIAVALDFINPQSGMLEPFALITKSFGDYIGMKNCAYIDTNNCPFVEQLLEYGFARNTGFTKRSGFCEYPLWEFKEEFLKEHGAENYTLYRNEYDRYMKETFGHTGEESDDFEENDPDIKM